MAKEIDKIIQSKTAPKSNNVLWDDGENLKINRNGKWENTVGSAPMINITYANLVDLRNNNKLIAGMQYRITDYVTTTAQENTRSAEHQFDVIVTADNENTLNEVARVCRSEFDIEKYKDAYSNTSGVKMLYVGLFSHDGKKYHLYEADDHSIQMLMDFNVIIRCYFEPSEEYPYISLPSYTRWNNEGQWGEWYDGIREGETICFKYYPIVTYFNTSNLAAWQIWYSLDNDTERFAWADIENGKGVIYRMIDEWNNDCPYDFKNIQFWRGVYDGGGIATDGDEDMNFHLFTFSFRTEDNEIIDTSVFGNNGRLLNDEWQITGVYGNVIGQYMSYDGSIENPTKTTQRLNDIVFYSRYDYDGGPYYGCYSNTFGNNCAYNSFGNNCYSNTFGNDCAYNSFGNKCSSNNFGNECSFNSFGNECSFNSFGNECSYVELSEGTNYKTASLNSNSIFKVFNLADLVDLLN